MENLYLILACFSLSLTCYMWFTLTMQVLNHIHSDDTRRIEYGLTLSLSSLMVGVTTYLFHIA